jgi:SynChlorMet cassette radical SAM/SPASM protein ScmF
MSEPKISEIETTFKLEQIYFYLTEGCNLACRHCWLSPKLQNKHASYPVLSVGLFKSILDQGKELGLKTIKLTGGEPLMHPGIIEILDSISEREYAFSIESNGVLCSPKLAKQIARHKSAFVSISLDGADAYTHESIRGITGCFDKAVNGIKNLVQEGVNTQVIFTVMDYNKHQLSKIVKLSESFGAESLKFNVVQPTGRGEKWTSNGNSLGVKELLNLSNYVEQELSPSTKLKLYFDVPIAFRPLSRMFGREGEGCAACSILSIIGVLANGHYALCGIGSHVHKLVFGDASQVPLEEAWNSNKVLQELRIGIPEKFEGICGACHMKRMCTASCIAQNYYRTKRLWAPFWFCNEAYDQGLFPESRMSRKLIK